MKKFVTLLVLLSTVVVASAQISTGQSTSSVLKTGNRPTSGDWGIYVGTSYSDFESIIAPEMTFEGFPLVNIKHYLSNNLEARLGIQIQGTTTSTSGTNTYEISSTELTSKFKDKVSEGTNRFRPGFAYHFSKRNLLDVYMGAEIPLGWNNRSVSYSKIDGSETYEDFSKEVSSSPFFVGIGAFIGIQCFVADLPLAIGVEYGILGLKEFGTDKAKVVSLDEDGNKTTQYYISNANASESITYFDSLNSSRSAFSNDARITITYYFKSR